MLASIAAAARLVSFEPGTVVFRPGDEADMLYGLIEGEVELSLVAHEQTLHAEVQFEEAVYIQKKEQASTITVDTARSGHIVGWSALSGRGQRTVIATCNQAVRAVAIPASELKAMCEKNHSLGYLLMKRLVDIIARRLDNRSKSLIEVWTEAFRVSKVSP
jgi:CRP-like cAMP-binding protein